jgi:type 1 glutamine amidotransferase
MTKSALLMPFASAALALLAVCPVIAQDSPPDGAAEKIAAALPAKAFEKPAKPRKLLIFSKTNGFHHASIATGKLAFTEMGKKTGAFEAVVSDDLSNFEPDKIKQFDAIMFLSTTQDPFGPSENEWKAMDDKQKAEAKAKEEPLKKSLLEFVKSGKGFIGIHAATDTFYDWPEYGQMIGGYFDQHPWTADKHVSIKVEPGQEKNPLVAMFDGKSVDFNEEIYQLKDPYDSSKLDMLLRLDPAKSDMNVQNIHRKDQDFGVAWVHHFDKGRVFYCSIGHNHEMYWNPTILSHYLAGIQWAIGDYKVKTSH